jgi:ABC-type taurine transport system substrate-binding protein
MSRSNTDRFAVVPRLLTRQQAAAYCGVSVPTFEGICSVKAIALGNGKRLERFDRVSLDAWIDSLALDGPEMKKDWLAELEKQ